MQQAVIGHDARHPRGLFLIQQQFERLLLAHGIGRAHLAFERTGLMRERAALVLRLGAQLRELADVGLEAAVEAALCAQRLANASLEIAQLLAHGVAPALKLVEARLQLLDARAQLLEPLFLVTGHGCRGQQREANKQQYHAAPRCCGRPDGRCVRHQRS